MVRIFAASSLRNVFTDAGRRWEALYPSERLECIFAGSQVLRTQIEQGASVDVFASADPHPMESLRRLGRVGFPRIFARNRMAVVAPPGGRVRRIGDMARPGVKLSFAGPSVPAGRYTAMVIAHINRSGRYGAGFRAGVERNVVSRESNVRAVLSKVLLGEVDAGIVYDTDAAPVGRKIRFISIPATFNVTATYSIAAVRNGPSPAGGERFISFLFTPASRAILRRHGFR